MKTSVSVDLAPRDLRALDEFAKEHNLERGPAIALALREFLIASGFIQWIEIDEATATSGTS